MKLTDEQNEGVSRCLQTLKTKRGVFRLGGFAGTGKTTCSKFITAEASDPISCALTGKATSRLIETGVPSITIHKAIYRYDAGAKKFYLRDEVNGSYFLIDEGSMVGGRIWADILSFRLPVIVIGDPGQLQPVADSDPGLMIDPDFTLNTVHRQALQSGIIRLATDIRCREYSFDNYKDVDTRIGDREQIPTNDDVVSHDIMLCGYNATRVALNRRYRTLTGRSGLLTVGEKIICLLNDYTYHVHNGQTFTVQDVGKSTCDETIVTVTDILGNDYQFPVINDQFHKKDKPEFDVRPGTVYADYAYAITVHKSQGSEWDKVLVMDQQCEVWDQTRWRYTAVTRAAKELTVLYKEAT